MIKFEELIESLILPLVAYPRDVEIICLNETEDNLELISELENEIDDLKNSERYSEIFQYFIISEQGASILEEYTNEIVYYNEALDLYVWGVTHYGTSWDYVLTDIPCERSEKA